MEENKEQEKGLVRRQLLSKYVIILILLLGTSMMIMNYVMSNYYSELYSVSFISIPLYFFAIGVIILTLISNALFSCDSKKYTRMYMLTRTIKILSFLIFVVVGTLCTEKGKVAYIISSVGFALVYMVFEIIVLLKLNKETHEFQINRK